MDRFIVLSLSSLLTPDNNLKSSMDRFIVILFTKQVPLLRDLKSSMDRFIGIDITTHTNHIKFKIQYGQIYRKAKARPCQHSP